MHAHRHVWIAAFYALFDCRVSGSPFTGCYTSLQTLVGLTLILGVLLSAQFCLGLWEFGRSSCAADQDVGTYQIKVNSTQVRDHQPHPVVRLVGHVDLVVLCLLGIMSHYSAASFGSAFKSSPPVVPIHRSHRPLPLWPPPREQKGHL